MTKRIAPDFRQAHGLPATLRSLALLAIALILSACGTSTSPQAGILPSNAGNVQLQVEPSDAQVVLVPLGDDATGRGTFPQLIDGEFGVWEYQLEAGDYKFRASRAGYEPTERTFTITEEQLNASTVIRVPSVTLRRTSDSAQPGDDRDAAVNANTELEMLVNSGFSADDLNPELREQYELFWSSIQNPQRDPYEIAALDDSYEYGRNLHTYLQAMLMMFRFTGDEAILNEVYQITEVMRGELKDEWTGTLDGTDGTRDGYLGWAYRYKNSREYNGKDTHKLNDLKTSSIIATVAYAFELNRDIDPKYAEGADFWTDYLINHYEAKWRERLNRPTGYPIYQRPHSHTYISGIKYHFYMYKLTGNPDYLDYAERASNTLIDSFILTETGDGRGGYVWNRSILAEIRDHSPQNYLLPTTYARYFFADVVELHLAGLGPWEQLDMAHFSNIVADFMIDKENASGRDWFARDIGGGRSREGIPSDSSWRRETTNFWVAAPIAFLSPWDETGRIADISRDALRDLNRSSRPGYPHIPVAMYMDMTLK